MKLVLKWTLRNGKIDIKSRNQTIRKIVKNGSIKLTNKFKSVKIESLPMKNNVTKRQKIVKKIFKINTK